MKILYGLPSSGNGHITRCMALIPELRKHAEVDVLISGPDYGLKNELKPKYIKTGFSFNFSKKNKVSIRDTLNSSRFLRFAKDVATLDLSEYDLVISDSEPITSWAARFQHKKSIGIGNALVYLSKKFRKKYNVTLPIDEALRFYCGCQKYIAISYKKLDDWFYTPIIRDEIRKAPVSDDSHYTVYLNTHAPSSLLKHFRKLKGFEFEIFNPKVKKERKHGNVKLMPVRRSTFIKSLASSSGFITAAGFEATNEGLFLGKKMLVIPIDMHEQKMNAKMLSELGVKTIKGIDDNFEEEFNDWVINYDPVKVKYPDVKKEIAGEIIAFAKERKKRRLEMPPFSNLREIKRVFEQFYFG